MGSNGGNAPNPFTQRKASTRFLRVPIADWPAVKIGRKTEFRLATKRPSRINYTPTPVVAYSLNGSTYDRELMVLEDVRRETLWQIKEQPESLAAEGFASYEDFRRYWLARHRSFDPLSMVYVYVMSPFDPDFSPEALGARLVEHLYGEFMPDGRS